MNDKRVEAAAKVICLELNGISYRDADDNEKEEATFLAGEAITASDAAAWQPIETAPDNQEICILWKTETVSVGTKNKDEWWFLNEDKMFGTHAALGWQPLPAPPSRCYPLS